MQELRSIRSRIENRLFTCIEYAKAFIVHELRRPTKLGAAAGRLGEPRLSKEPTQVTTQPDRLICIFTIYSSHFSLSTISYLQALREAGFEIIAINNRPTPESLLGSLSQICWRIYDRSNIGRDIGAYKDAILMLHHEGLLSQCKALCIANDSTEFIGGNYGKTFTSEITQFLESPASALFTHYSHQINHHYQSYFQVLKSDVIKSKKFITFWQQYKPLSHRGHCIRKGEIAASEQIYNEIRHVRVLYSAEMLLHAIGKLSLKEAVSIDKVLAMMPSISHTMARERQPYALEQLSMGAKSKAPLNGLSEHWLAELIESSNPSHAAAFLYPMFLNCPLVKKDLCLAGSFSKGKALQLFRETLHHAEISEDEIEARMQEFRLTIESRGIPMDFRKKPWQRVVKGATNIFVYA